MTTTQRTKLVSFRIELNLLEKLKDDIRIKSVRRLRKVTLSSLLNEIVSDYYQAF